MSTTAAPEDLSKTAQATIDASKAESPKAQIIDGTAIAKSIRTDIAQRISSFKARYPRFEPHLVIIQAGSRPDSSTYVRMKAKACAETGIKFTHIQLDADASVEDVVKAVRKLNDDETVSGILVQLPLGDHVTAEGERKVTEAVSPEKDVDGWALPPPARDLLPFRLITLL